VKISWPRVEVLWCARRLRREFAGPEGPNCPETLGTRGGKALHPGQKLFVVCTPKISRKLATGGEPRFFCGARDTLR